MSQKIWEIHARTLPGAIRTTPDGHAEIGGTLVLSEKAYLLAVRDFRPYQILEMVRSDGASLAAERLIEHYSDGESLRITGGRSLISTRGLEPLPIVRRSDEVSVPFAARR